MVLSPPSLSLFPSLYGTNRLKNAPKRIRFHVDNTLFLSLHCTCFLFFTFLSLFLSLFFFLGKILKLLDRNKAANCAKLFSPLFIPPPFPFLFPAYAVYSISQKRGQHCPNASTSRIRPTGWLAQMMRCKWNILSQSWSEKWTNQATCPKVPLQVMQTNVTICNWSDCNIFSMRFSIHNWENFAAKFSAKWKSFSTISFNGRLHRILP